MIGTLAHAPLFFLVAAHVAAGSAAAVEARRGPWRVSCTDRGIAAVRHNGLPVLRNGSFGVYKPGYKGQLFSLRECTPSIREEPDAVVVEWVREVPDAGRLVMQLRLTDEWLEWRAEMRFSLDGPIEMGIHIPTEALTTPAGVVSGKLGEQDLEIGEARHDRIHFGTPLHFPMPRREWRFDPAASSGGWVFQDDRDKYAAYRIIALLRARGEEAPFEAEVSLRLGIREFTGDEAATREKILSQTTTTRIPLPLANGGFEDNLSGTPWYMPTTAAITQDGASEGANCAKIEVGNKEERGIYITRQVPVQPGRCYVASAMVRSRDVARAKVLGMISTGAVLIVEWADGEGKWLAPGAYARGQFGTSGWRRQRIAPIIAPERAARAILYLGLRGTGTAWFDDVTFSACRRTPALLGPIDGARIQHNRPRFTWRRHPAARRYRVQIATAPDFAAVRRTTIEGTSFRPRVPLAPGTWYWRVGIDEEEPGETWTFRQTAPAELDMVGPDLVLEPFSVRAPRTPLNIVAGDESGLDPTSAVLLLDHRPVAVEATVSPEGAILVPRRAWPRGAHAVTVRLADRAGNTSEAETWLVNTPPPPQPIVWTRDRGVRVGNRHEFPLGIYQVTEEDMQRVKEAGFDLIHLYTWEGSQDDAAARQYLDAARRAGLRVFMGFDRGRSSGRGLIQGDLGHMARRVAALRDHPALYAWYLFDEPDLDHQYISPKNMKRLYDALKTYDPDHPVIVTFAKTNSVAEYGLCFDVHWTQVYGGTKYVFGRLGTHREVLREHPLMAIVHSYDRDRKPAMKTGRDPADEPFQPDGRTLRANALMALVLGSSGLVWWWFGNHGRTSVTTADIPDMWRVHGQLVAEIRGLRPALAAPGEEVGVEVACSPESARAAARVKTLSRGGGVLIAVNPSGEACEVVFRSAALAGLSSVAVPGENRTLPVRDGVLRDSFEPLGARVYRWK